MVMFAMGLTPAVRTTWRVLVSCNLDDPIDIFEEFSCRELRSAPAEVCDVDDSMHCWIFQQSRHRQLFYCYQKML